MRNVFTILIISAIFLFFINIIFVIFHFIIWSTEGINAIFQGMSLSEKVYYSIYFKWIILSDIVWASGLIIFVFKRKQYKTNIDLYYLIQKPIINPKICVIIPTFNEELGIKQVVDDYIDQKNVEYVYVIDNNSSDNTVKIAEKCGATVFTKKNNEGFAHSCVMGLQKSLQTDANIVVLTEADGTYSGSDLKKMVPYLDNTDMVVGSREIQVLSEKGNQNKMLYVWGNFLLAKLVQIKFFSLQHMGVISLTDIGCSYRCIRREALEKIITQFLDSKTGKIIVKPKSGLFAPFTTMLGIKNDLRIVEVPITFKKRIGISKTESDKHSKALGYALEFFWFILRS